MALRDFVFALEKIGISYAYIRCLLYIGVYLFCLYLSFNLSSSLLITFIAMLNINGDRGSPFLMILSFLKRGGSE